MCEINFVDIYKLCLQHNILMSLFNGSILAGIGKEEQLKSDQDTWELL